jgi:hypothetical protein
MPTPEKAGGAGAGAGGGEADWDLEIAGPTGLWGSGFVGEAPGVVLSGSSVFEGGLGRSGVRGSAGGGVLGADSLNASSKASRAKESAIPELAFGLTFANRSADVAADLKSEPSELLSIFSGSRFAIISSSNLPGPVGEVLSVSSSSSFRDLADCDIDTGFLAAPKILDDLGVSEVPAIHLMEFWEVTRI